jgi:DNA-binding transcriptional ArsR family regulator
MANLDSNLNAAFHSLAHPIRRAVVARLVRGPAPVAELARPFSIGLPTFMKHLRILEQDGLIHSQKQGRTRTCRVNADRIAVAEHWLTEQRVVWEGRTDRLANYVQTQLTNGDTDNG